MFLKSSLSLLVLKVGSSTPLSFSWFHFHFLVTLSLWMLSFTLCLPPDEEALALKACGK